MGMDYLDVASYYSAYDTILTGKVDALRTPLLPILAGIPNAIFGYTGSRIAVYIFQGLMFIFSIKWLGKTLENITENKRVSYWFTAIYALSPGMLSYCCIVMTESLSISLMTAVIYLVSEAFYHDSCKKAAMSGFVCLLLWLLRPSLMPITLILLFFWICMLLIKGKKTKKTAICGLCATLISLAALGIYAMLFYKAYNKVGVSCVSTLNNYVTIREAGAIDVDKIESPQIRSDVDSMSESPDHSLLGVKFEEIRHLQDKYGIAEADKFVNDQIRLHPMEIISFLYHVRLDNLIDDKCVFPGHGNGMPTLVASFTRLISVNNGAAFMIFLTALSILIYNDAKRRRLSCFVWLLLLFFAENYLTIWIGAPSAFTRLSASNYSVLIAISCWLLDQLVTKAVSCKDN